jgi:hypothetical protein
MRPGAAEDKAYFQAEQCGICGVQTNTARSLLCPSASNFLCHHNSEISCYLFIHNSYYIILEIVSTV